jgi:GTP-binding protein
MKKIVAIVGRPNVGKSTLFNRLIGQKIAIVHDTPGVTRDRNYGEAEWNSKKFFLIDTGGYVPPASKGGDTFESAIREQVKISIEEADLVLFLVDAKTGLTPFDLELASVLRKEMSRAENLGKKVLLVVNKVDNKSDEAAKNEFYELGLGEPIMVSATVGRMSGDLLDVIIDELSFDDLPEETEDDNPKFAVIGRPNVGKSSLVNSLIQQERNIVTDMPGTTRDSIDSVLKYYGKNITIIDTAGLRKKSKIRKAESLEYYSTLRTQRSIEKCDVAILVLDAPAIIVKLEKSSDFRDAVYKVNREDVEIIWKAAELKKGILVVINKWDLVENKDSDTAKIFEDKIKEHLKTLSWLPFIFVSALTKQRISKVLDKAMEVYDERNKEVKTSQLNDVMGAIIKDTPPSGKSKREIKINYITQVQTGPPVIAFYTNIPSEIEENYKRFLENKLRQNFGFIGVPLTLTFKKKN